jgi:hypothetical protein
MGAFAADAAAWAKLPDLTGTWVVDSKPPPRPPYNAEWAAKQKQAVADAAAGKIPDPVKTCGLPYGNPWMLYDGDLHEWVVRPDGVWHNVENTGVTSRIYTDGRPHLGAEDIFPTYTGDSTGKWEGDTLVVDTIALRDDTWLGPGALIHSDKLHLTERMHKTGPDRLQIDVVAEDPVAFTKPWTFAVTYRRAPRGAFVHEYACKILHRSGDDKG